MMRQYLGGDLVPDIAHAMPKPNWKVSWVSESLAEMEHSKEAIQRNSGRNRVCSKLKFETGVIRCSASNEAGGRVHTSSAATVAGGTEVMM